MEDKEMAKKVVIETTLWSLECKYRDALYTTVDGCKSALLKQLEFIINSDLSHEKAIDKLRLTYELYFGNLLGVDYMFNRMLDEETKNELEFCMNNLREYFSRQLRYEYGKIMNRLDKIYKNS